MSMSKTLIRESRFMARDRAVLIWMLVVFCLSSLAVWSGSVEVQHQRDTIAHLLEVDQQDRSKEFLGQSDWGGAAVL